MPLQKIEECLPLNVDEQIRTVEWLEMESHVWPGEVVAVARPAMR